MGLSLYQRICRYFLQRRCGCVHPRLVREERPKIEREPDSAGFGTLLAKSTVRGQLRGELTRDWKSEGLAIRLVFAARSVHS